MLVDFWTYTCINCIRTLPYTRAWDAAYRSRGLTIVGVHTPEFQFEHDAANVQDAIAQNRLRYPVAQDNDYKTWNAWGNEYWPAKYLIDAKGRVRYVHFGEGDDKKTEAAIRSLLAEAGAESLGGDAKVGPDAQARQGVDARDVPRLGARPGLGAEPAVERPARLHRRRPAPDPQPLRVHRPLEGRPTRRPPRWRRARRIDAHVVGKAVYLVLSSQGDRPRELRVELDGKPLRTVTVRRQRLYTLVSLPKTEEHKLTLRFAPGLSGYAFTFG